MITPEKQIQAVVGTIRNAQQAAFWGKIILTFQQGQLKMTEIAQTIPTEKLCVSYSENIAIPIPPQKE